MRKHSFIGAFIILFMASSLQAQKQKLDSLKKLLYTTKEVSFLADLHLEIADLLYDEDIKVGFEESNLAYQLAKSVGYKKGEKKSLSFIGFKYFLDGDHAKALNYFHQSDAIDSKVEPVTTGYNWTLMGNLYRVRTEYDSAEFFFNKAIGILKTTDDLRYLSYAYKNIGLIRQTQYRLDEASDYFKLSLELRKQIKNKRGLIDSNLTLGALEMSRSNYIGANKYFDTACHLIEDEFDSNVALKVNCYLNDGTVHCKLGDYALALTQLFKALNLLKDHNFTYLYGKTSSQIGEVYAELAQFDLSLTYYFECLRNFEKIQAKKEIGDALSEIAWVYKGQLNFPLALEFLDRSQKIRQAIKDEHGLSNCYNIRGLIYLQKKQYPAALEEMNKALTIRKRLNYREGIAAVWYNLALVYQEQGDFSKALAHQIQSIEMEKEFGSDLGMGLSYNSIGGLLIHTKDYKGAEEYLNKGLKSATKTKSKFLLRDNYLFFSQLFENKSDFEKSLHYRKLYDQIKDSIYVMVNSTKIAEMQALYHVEQKNQEILLQDTKLNLQEDQIKQKNTIITSITSGIILTTLLAYITFRYSRSMRKANREIIEQKEEIQAQSEELIEANETIGQINKNLELKIDERTSEVKQAYKELDTFFYRSSHDFRRPLTTFLGLAEVARVTVKDTNALELFDKVKETALNLDRMLIKLQSISDLGAQQLIYEEIFFEALITQILDGFNELIISKNIQVTVNIAPHTSFKSYPAMVKIVFENLIENAIHFCGVVNQYIKINVFLQQGKLVIEVQDNGQGIKQEYFSRIFDMYYRANMNSKGNGLGLYIVKKSVEKLNGQIHFTSLVAQGSRFEVVLPSEESMHMA